MRRLVGAVVGASARRPLAVVVAVVAAAIVCAALATRLDSTASPQTIGGATDAYAATEEYQQAFGGDAVIVLVRGKLTELLLSEELGRLLGLEGCLSGRVPRGATPPGGKNGPCGQIARSGAVQVVYGPATFINESSTQIANRFVSEQRKAAAEARRAGRAARELAKAQGKSPAEQRRLQRAAEQLASARFLRDMAQLALTYGLTDVPRVDDPRFVSQLVFDAARGPGVPKARFAYLFPSPDAALIQVRLKPDLSRTERDRAAALIEDATKMPQWRLQSGSYAVTGLPVVIEEVADAITTEMLILLAVAVVVMAAALLVVFRGRPRLLPLAVALAVAALVFGVMGLIGAPLTMASAASLPVIIGLIVDYAIQFQARVAEVRRRRSGGGEGEGEALDIVTAIREATQAGGPTLILAALATAAGFVGLLISPVPMVRGFGAVLVAGALVGLVLTFTFGTAALVLADQMRRGRPVRPRRLRAPGPVRRVSRTLRSGFRAALRGATANPGRVLLAAIALALIGWVAATQTKVNSDLQELVPQDLAALRAYESLQEATGVVGQVDVLVTARNVASPEVVNWMREYRQELLDRYGYSLDRGCGEAALCPGPSLSDLFPTAASARTSKQIEAQLDAIPQYLASAVVTQNRRAASLSFGIRRMPLAEQKEVIDEMRDRLNPPPGVDVRIAGLPAIGAEANDLLASPMWRALMLALGLVLAAVVLLIARRRLGQALLPLAPIVLATGWSSLVLFLLRIPLNPMSAILVVLVVAIATEFSVLLHGRYADERAAGHEPAEALARTYRSTGRAVFASGLTSIAGFAVVIVSDIRMLREFGLVTVIDLAVALIGVMLVLPAVLAYAERRARARAAKRDRPARSEHLPGFAPGAGRPGGGPMTSRPSVTGRGS